MDAIITTGQAERNGNPKAYSTGKFDRRHLDVWTSGPLQGARRIRGVPELTLTVRSSAAAATLVAYLFDVGADDTARIITHEPLTLPELSPGENRRATWKLRAAGYDLAPDHRLMLVVNSKDRLYSDASTEHSITTITSGDDTAAHLVLPLGCPSSTAPGQARARWQVRVHRVRSLLVATARVRPDGEKPTARSSE
ncbi:CocE/NonD family hydrolase C-terminal non-catalytic domain-containing protein [Streptomyces sp. NPDC041003]|uniref:CocE/NonD family hydrolase C-terminal non-catalytic domain-containing protein n=1 Tax=Streptomyces sp. NPDC041003 TaxID=3155730 RepID=UPI0033CB3835